MANDILSGEEQNQLFQFARSLGLDFNEYLNSHPDTRERVVIAGIRAGRLPGAEPPYHILVKPNEEVLIEGSAYKLQPVGTDFNQIDEGVLSVTSTRIVFGGKASTHEITYANLYNLTLFAIGVTECMGIAVSRGGYIDTQTYALGNPRVFAAIITAARHSHLSPPSNVGLISEDGVWKWDGQAWQPNLPTSAV